MDLKLRLYFQQSMQCVKWAASGWLCGPGQMLVWCTLASTFLCGTRPSLSIIVAAVAGYVQVKAGWATVLWGCCEGWYLLGDAFLSLCFCVHIYPGPVARTKNQQRGFQIMVALLCLPSFLLLDLNVYSVPFSFFARR